MADMTTDEKIDSIWQVVKELAENDKKFAERQEKMDNKQTEILDILGTMNERMDILTVEANKNKADIRILKSNK